MRLSIIAVAGLLTCTLLNGHARAGAGGKSAHIHGLDIAALATDAVNTRLAGVPLVQTIGRLDRADSLKQGDFETTAAFQARQRAISGWAELTVGPVVFVASVAHSKGLSYSYDPNTQTLNLLVRSVKRFLSPFGEASTLEFESVQAKPMRYVAQNSFGARAVVTKMGSTSYGVAFVLPPPYISGGVFNETTVLASIPMTAPQAAKEIPRLRAAVAMSLVQPGVETVAGDGASATVVSPIEEATEEKYVFGTFEGLVFYSGISGQVFARSPKAAAKSSQTDASTSSTPESR